MDEKERELQELKLEQIIKEFGGEDPEQEISLPLDEIPELEEEPKLSLPIETLGEGEISLSIEDLTDMEIEEPAREEAGLEALSIPENPEPFEQAPAEEALEEAAPVPMDDTIRLDTIQGLGQAEPEAETIAAPVPEEDQTEPFSENWEPEYEQPIGEYIPPEPIVFRPRSRLRELKRKLIAGPEKRYYELIEQGIGKLQAAIFLNLLVVLLSAGATAIYALGMTQESRLKLMVFVQFFAMLLSALLGCNQLIEGVCDLFHKRFSLNTMLVVTLLACCADGIFGLRELRVPCCAAFSLEMTMSLWSAYHRRVTERGQMDTMRKAIRLDSLVRTPDYYEGKPGILRGEGQVEDFMDAYQQPSKLERIQNIYALAALGVSVAAGVAAGVLHGVSFGVQVLAVSCLAAVPATSFVALSRPEAVLERRLHRLGTVLCGWRGVEGLCGSVVFPLGHEDLFPSGSIRMNGVKFYGSRDTDEVVAYAAALIAADGGGLVPLFTQLLDSRNGRHYDVESLQTYGGGIGGEINGEPVLIGVLQFMRDMGVDIPEGTRVNQAVYLAIDGELCGLFALTYNKLSTAAAGITTLCSYRKLTSVLVTGDFMLTDGFLRAKFGVNTRRIVFPERAVRAELERRQPEEDAPALALTTQEGLAAAAFAVTGARALRTASTLGLAVHMLGGIVGLIMMVVLAVLGEAQLLTPVNLLLYQLVWMIPGLLLTEWTRSV